MRKLISNSAWMAVLVAILIVISMALNQNTVSLYRVDRVIDGDTIIVDLDGKFEIVRLIGVDSPESVNPNLDLNTPEGLQASEYTKENLLNKKVKLETDIQERDKYGRLLAYVFIDEELFNAKIIMYGYGEVLIIPPNVKYENKIREAYEKKAR